MAEFRFLFTSSDYDATVAFFVEKMGLEVLRSWDGGPDDRGTILIAAGTGEIEVFAGGADAAPPSGVGLAWEVADVDATIGRLVAAGVPVTEAPGDRPWGHRNATIAGPHGLPITLFTPLG